MEWQQYAMLFELLFVVSVIYNFRETIIEKYYGVRFKRWLIIDTGQSGYTILNKALNSCNIMKTPRSVAYDNIQRGWLYYTHDCAENLKIVNDNTQWTTYCNTEEFNTVNQTKIFQMLLYVMEKNWIVIIAILVGVSIAVSGYVAYTQHNQQQYFDYIVYQLNQTQSTHGADIIVNR